MRIRQVFAGLALVVITTAALVAFGPTPGAGANPAPGIPPDFTLRPNEPVQTHQIKSTMVGAPRNDQPLACREDRVASNVCDAFRLKLIRSTEPGAQNYVVIFLDYEHNRTPAVPVVAVVINSQPVPDLDLVVYRTPTTSLASAVNGGQDFNTPERVAFVANQNEYDLVIKNDQGLSNGYTLRMFMLDELFDNSFELIDEVNKRIDDAPAPSPPPEQTDFTPPPSDGVTVADPNALAPLAPVEPRVDSRITGIGLAPRQQFGSGQAIFGDRTQRVVKIGEAPSAAILVLALLVVPLAFAFGGALWLRRRRQALI